MSGFYGDNREITPEAAIDTAEMFTGALGFPPESAAWVANLMLIVEDAATSGCPCEGCTRLAEVRNDDVPA